MYLQAIYNYLHKKEAKKKIYRIFPQKWMFRFKIEFQNFQKPYIKLKKAPIVLDKEAELEKLAFQRVAKNIIKARENKHNGIRFFSKS